MSPARTEAMTQLTDRMAQQQQGFAPSPGGERMIAQGATLQQIKTPFITAISVQQPRDRNAVLDRVLEEVAWEPDEMYYSWPARNKDGSQALIEGPTIKMAMAIAREWGNCSCDAEVVEDEGTHWRMKGYFIDAERGFVSSREFRMRKPTQGKGRMDLERTVDIAFQIGQSKAIRNAVTNGVPAAFIKRAMNAAKSNTGEQMTKGGLSKGVERCIGVFKKIGVTAEQLEEKTEKKRKEWSKQDLVKLRGIFNAIEEGQTSVADQFGTNGQVEDDLASSMGLDSDA